ncbi:MAG TPA: hypothetical protein VGM53_06180 [Streptosporangiaceae bacterium]
MPAICSGVVDGSGSSYYFGTQPVMAIPTTGTGFTGSEKALQSRLNKTRSGGTVALAHSALVSLTAPLVVPKGVTLTTEENPGPRQYAEMGRLVRSASYPRPASLDALVHVEPGAKLDHVWVDGTRDTPGNTAPLEDVITYGGSGTTLSDDRFDNAQGPNTVYLFGSFDGYACPAERVTGNVITAYASDHYQSGDWTDGIADNCEQATISRNSVIDSSDVAIVVYRDTAATPQRSVVTGNAVLSAGNSMYGGLGFDPLYEPASQPAKTFSFGGASIKHNTLWSGPDTHFDIGITDGSRAWFAGTYTADTGTGASITGNTTGQLTARVQIGIGVNGMLHTTVSGNTMKFAHISAGNCPKDDYAAEISEGYASGTFSPKPADINFDGCV